MKLLKIARSSKLLWLLPLVMVSAEIPVGAEAYGNSAPLQYPPPTGTGYFIYVPESWQTNIVYNGIQTYTAYQRGYEANFSASNPTIILDFGRQIFTSSGNWGVVLVSTGATSGPKHSMTWTKNIAQAFIDGYGANPAHQTTYIAIGTNTSNYDWYCRNEDPANLSSLWRIAGNEWGKLVMGITPRAPAMVKSGNDIEAFYNPKDFGPWVACGIGVQSWFDGYQGQTSIANYDFGNNPHNEYPSQWTVDQTYQVAWGRPPAYNIPEIYCSGSGWAQSWVEIRQYNYISFLGVTSLNGTPGPGGCDIPSLDWQTSWNDLNNALTNVGYPDSVLSTAVIYNPNP